MQASGPAAKQPYSSPRLTVYGNVLALTQVSGGKSANKEPDSPPGNKRTH